MSQPPPEMMTIGALCGADIDAMLGTQQTANPVRARVVPMAAPGMFKLAIFQQTGVNFSDWNEADLRGLYDAIGQTLGIEPAPKVQVARTEDIAMLKRISGQ